MIKERRKICHRWYASAKMKRTIKRIFDRIQKIKVLVSSSKVRCFTKHAWRISNFDSGAKVAKEWKRIYRRWYTWQKWKKVAKDYYCRIPKSVQSTWLLFQVYSFEKHGWKTCNFDSRPKVILSETLIAGSKRRRPRVLAWSLVEGKPFERRRRPSPKQRGRDWRYRIKGSGRASYEACIIVSDTGGWGKGRCASGAARCECTGWSSWENTGLLAPVLSSA